MKLVASRGTQRRAETAHEIIRSFPVVGSDGVSRVRCAECRKMYQPDEAKSKREKMLRSDGRYICRPCIASMEAESLQSSMDSEDGCMYYRHILLTHTDSDFIEKIRVALCEKYGDENR